MHTRPSCEPTASRCDCPPRSECPPTTVAFHTAVMVRSDAGELALGASTEIGSKSIRVVFDHPVPFPDGSDVEVSFPVPHRHAPIRLTGRLFPTNRDGSDGRSQVEIAFDVDQTHMLASLDKECDA